MPDLDQQIRVVLNGYDHDAAGQIDDLTGAIRAVLDYATALENATPITCGALRRIIATQLGLTQETTP